MVETNKTHFGHVYGYGLVVLWVTTMLWTAIATLISTPFDIGMAVQTSFLTLVILTIFALPIAALITVIVGGIIWAAISSSTLPNNLKAMFAGGVSGATPTLIFYVTAGIRDVGLLRTTILLFVLGVWCGWLRERLARRHVKVDPKTVAEAFE